MLIESVGTQRYIIVIEKMNDQGQPVLHDIGEAGTTMAEAYMELARTISGYCFAGYEAYKMPFPASKFLYREIDQRAFQVRLEIMSDNERDGGSTAYAHYMSLL